MSRIVRLAALAGAIAVVGNARHLANAQHQVIVQPNNDTLYSNAHLDLTGPLVLHVPRVRNHRYYSFEFLDPYTNVFAYVGTRTTGEGPADFLITGPGWHGAVPTGMRRIRSPYRRAWRSSLATTCTPSLSGWPSSISSGAI